MLTSLGLHRPDSFAKPQASLSSPAARLGCWKVHTCVRTRDLWGEGWLDGCTSIPTPEGKSLCTLQLVNLESKIATLLVSFLHGVTKLACPSKMVTSSHTATHQGDVLYWLFLSLEIKFGGWNFKGTVWRNLNLVSVDIRYGIYLFGI